MTSLAMILLKNKKDKEKPAPPRRIFLLYIEKYKK